MKDSLELMKTSMAIITSAGEGRNLIAQAFDSALLGNYEKSLNQLEEGFSYIKEAHIGQTKVIQKAMGEENNEEESAELLFSHAQDTVMTINTEYNLMKNMIEVYKKLDERLKKVEELLND